MKKHFGLNDLFLLATYLNLPDSMDTERRFLIQRDLPGIENDPALPVIRQWLRERQTDLQGMKDYLVARCAVPLEDIDEQPLSTVARHLQELTQPRNGKQPRSMLKIKGDRVYLNGEEIDLDLTPEAKETALRFLRALNQSPGNWLSRPEMGLADERLDRLKKGLPLPLQNIIQSNRRKGYRLMA